MDVRGRRGVRKKKVRQKKKHLVQRKGKGSFRSFDPSSFYDSDSDVSSDEAYPHEPERPSRSAFSDKLSLFSPQKRVTKRVSREAVVETVFSALFARNSSKQGGKNNQELTDTESDINEEFLKRGLTLSLFKDGAVDISRDNAVVGGDPLRRYVDAKLIHKLVNELRFEDFRTPSARIDILRAITKHCPYHRSNITKALVDATYMRMKYTFAIQDEAIHWEVDTCNARSGTGHDHCHGFLELLRFLIEYTGESWHGFGRLENEKDSQLDCNEICHGLIRCLMHLCTSHCNDPGCSDEDELIDCAGQFVAYIPGIAIQLLQRILNRWPRNLPAAEVLFIRILARILMSVQRPDSIDPNTHIHLDVFRRLTRCVTSKNIQVAKEALAFTGSPFVLDNFVAPYQDIYTYLVKALHESKSHWNPIIQEIAEEQFEIILDFA